MIESYVRIFRVWWGGWVRSLGLGVLLGLGVGCRSVPQERPPTEEELRAKLKRAEGFLARSKFGQAQRLAEEVERYPQLLPPDGALRIRGIALLAQGRWKEAVEVYRRLISRDYRNCHFYHDLALALFFLSEFRPAAKNLERSLELNRPKVFFSSDWLREQFGKIEILPVYYPAFYNLGVFFARLGKGEEASRYLRKCLELRPKDSLSRLALLRLYLERRGVEDVVKLLGRFRFPMEYVWVAYSFYLRKKDYSGAARCLVAALGEHSDSYALYFRLGYTLLHLEGFLDSAIGALKKAKNLSKTGEVFKFLGLAYIQKAGKHSRKRSLIYFLSALRNFEDWLKLEPNSAQAYYYAGLCAQRLGRLAVAQGYYRKALSLEPKMLEARSNLLGLYVDSGSYGYAQLRLEEARLEASLETLFPLNLAIAYYYGGYPEAALSWIGKLRKGELSEELRRLYDRVEKGLKE